MKLRAAIVWVLSCVALAPVTSCSEPASPAADAGAAVMPAAMSAVPMAAASASVAPRLAALAAPAEKIAAQHVLVAFKGAKNAPKGVTRSKADAKKRAEEVRGKALAAGADFSALVAEYSDDPAKGERQGSLGVITPAKVVKPFADAAFVLPVDAVSNVVETEFGFHVIKRNQ